MPRFKKIRRINIFGGPCSSKSTLAAYLFSQLKIADKSIEYVSEYIKFWTYIDRKPQGYDQVYTFAKQLNQEDTILRNGVDLIVTDCPLLQVCFYSKYNETPAHDQLREIASNFNMDYPSINIFIDRADKAYKNIGRFHDKLEAMEIDKEMLSFMAVVMGQNFKTFKYYERDKVLTYVLEMLEWSNNRVESEHA